MSNAARTIEYKDVSGIVFLGNRANCIGVIQPVHAATIGWEELKLVIKQESESQLKAAMDMLSLL